MLRGRCPSIKILFTVFELGSWITMYPFIGYSVRVNSKIDKECLEHWKGRWEENVGKAIVGETVPFTRRGGSPPKDDAVFIFPQFAHIRAMQNFYDPISFK